LNRHRLAREHGLVDDHRPRHDNAIARDSHVVP
jgi:hypothetical protein